MSAENEDSREATPPLAERPVPLQRWLQHLKPSYDGPASWLVWVGASRVGMLCVVALGTQLVNTPVSFTYMLAPIFVAAFGLSVWYFLVVARQKSVSAALTWTQMLVDFGVVAATIGFTGGPQSFFTFLLVVVILEAGVLMGIAQGFFFATLSTVYMFLQGVLDPPISDPLTHWYNFLIQGISFFFAAVISGYWNQRIIRLKQFQREILDNMNNGFLITDNKGIVIAVNKAGCEILNLQEQNLAGLHVDGVLCPESGVECPVTTALRSGKDFNSYEFYAKTGGDQSKLLGLTTNRIRNTEGEVTALIASFTDLTEMARMRRELQQQDRMATIGELTAGLAHEIRNPVASIRGAMDEMRSNLESPEMTKTLATIAIRESDHLNEIVTGFLDFARNPDQRHELIDLRTLLEELRKQLLWKHRPDSGNESDPRLEVVIDVPEEPCWVMANTTQMRQVFMNLGDNAVEAMDGAGKLTVTVEQHEARKGGLKGPLEIRFDDEGPGIEPDQVARIFEPFYTGKERGVGMGLAICMRIINAHDGTIQAASRPGRGLSISIRLPAAAPETAAAPADAAR